MERENVPSVSIAVAYGRDVVWEESFGWADREHRLQATPQTMYDLASISKVFTATGLMILAERGLIDLDAPIQQYLGDLRIDDLGLDSSRISVRRVVQHTAGLPMFWESYTDEEASTQRSLAETLERYLFPAFPPGERCIYSNLGHGVSQHIIEQMSGVPYAKFVEEEVIDPLGMSDTTVLVSSSPQLNLAKPYDVDGRLRRFERSMVPTIAASAHDLLRFARFHLGHQQDGAQSILSTEAIKTMRTSVDPVSPYRLPWRVQNRAGYETVSFTGASGTVITLVPQEDLAVVVLANRLSANTVKISDWICSSLLQGNRKAQDRPKRRNTPQREATEDSSDATRFKGTWMGIIKNHESDISVQLRVSDEGVLMRQMGPSKQWGQWVAAKEEPGVRFSGGVCSAHIPLPIPVQDTARHPHWTWIYLIRDGETLRGCAVAHAAGGPHFGLPFLIRLERIL